MQQFDVIYVGPGHDVVGSYVVGVDADTSKHPVSGAIEGSRAAVVTVTKKQFDSHLDMWIKQRVLLTTACHYIIRQIDRISLAWVTVVLLGGFASQLGHCDFWFLTGLLFLQGVRYAADFTVIVTCNKSSAEIVSTGIGPQVSVALVDCQLGEGVLVPMLWFQNGKG